MSNGNHNLDDYFPAGSAELNSVRERVRGLIQSGTYADNTLMLTKKEFETAMAKSDKKAKLYFLYGLFIGIAGIIVTIITSYYW